MDKSVGVAVDVSVGGRGLPWFAVGASINIAVKNAMASATGLQGVQLLAMALRGSPWSVRRSPWNVRRCPCNMAVACRGGPWTLTRHSAKETNNAHPSTMLGGHRTYAHERLTAGRGVAMCWLRLSSWMTYSEWFPAGGEGNRGKSPTTLAWCFYYISSLTRVTNVQRRTVSQS